MNTRTTADETLAARAQDADSGDSCPISRWARLQAHWFLRAASHGHDCMVRGRPRMLLAGTTRIGDGLYMRSDVARIEVSVAESATLSIGNDVLLLDGTSIGVTERIDIGSRCRIGPHVQIMDNDFHRLEPDRRDERPKSRPIAIGDNVRIGAMALVLPGASIGAGSVVAARSVVLGEVAPNSLVMGSPARLVRRL